MITGFNTDVEYEGVTYHVQTEDKGVETPLILSLVYVGGAIIASKRTYYNDLIESGFDETVLTERLQRQHKLICAAIRTGRIEDLKRMGGAREASASGNSGTANHSTSDSREAQSSEPTSASKEEISSSTRRVEAKSSANTHSVSHTSETATQSSAPTKVKALDMSLTLKQNSVHKSGPVVPKGAEKNKAVSKSGNLYLNLLNEEEFRAGEEVGIRVYICRNEDGSNPIEKAAITVKILGTTFRPTVLTTSTDKKGMAVINEQLPRFTSGRAVVLIQANVDDDAVELRRVINQV